MSPRPASFPIPCVSAARPVAGPGAVPGLRQKPDLVTELVGALEAVVALIDENDAEERRVLERAAAVLARAKRASGEATP